MNAGTVIVKRQNQIIGAFRDARATFADNAKPLAELHCRNSLIFRRLVSKGVIVKCDKEKYYIDNRAADAFVVNRRRKVLIAIFIAGIIVVLGLQLMK